MKNFSVLFMLILLLTLSACSNDDNDAKQTDKETESETTQSETTIEEEQNNDNNVDYESEAEKVNARIDQIQEELDIFYNELKDSEEEFENMQVVDLRELYYGGKLSSGEDKLAITYGMFELSNYYNYGYRDAKDNFQAFEITDINGETIYAYVPRDSETYSKLLNAIDNGENSQYLLLKEYNIIDSGSHLMVEILDFFEAEFEQ